MWLNKKTLVFFLITLILMVGCSNKSKITKYDLPPMIFWKDTIYYVQDKNYESIKEEQIDKKIGEITKVIDGTETPKSHGIANIFKEGSNIFTLKGKKSEEIIVIQYENEYYIALSKSK
ncbi:hypothetical protein Y919_09670 [Caloranaerobacter azorensis H53214]|uniref:Lipoprotein n=1 Tax=Caloranaerobacter azorensis H53214 TaxID=1156417 RepID=A0A096BGF7_9FIRM|nr:hypothetical protein [Caloranaerobacter azorensis]KGG79838.1 hypothetical protein Y919_09670 [Caloranaerobacter azorensis H53214]